MKIFAKTNVNQLLYRKIEKAIVNIGHRTLIPDYTFFLRIAYTGKCTHTVRDSTTNRWKEKHGKSKDGIAIADMRRSPYEEKI